MARNMQSYLPGPAIELIQALGIRNPKPAPFIFTARFDVVAAEARRIVRIVGILAESSGRRI